MGERGCVGIVCGLEVECVGEFGVGFCWLFVCGEDGLFYGFEECCLCCVFVWGCRIEFYFLFLLFVLYVVVEVCGLYLVVDEFCYDV